MKMVFRLLVLGAVVALGLSIGCVLRPKHVARGSSPAAAVSSASAGTTAGSTRGLTFRPTVRSHDDSPLATQLERDLAASSGVTRWLYWLEALEKAAPSDFPRLFKLAQNHPATRRLVEARWIEIAPRQLFDLIVAGAENPNGLPVLELAYVLFDEWPKSDPDAAIAAVSEVAHVRASEDWRWTVAYGLIEKDIERALKLMRDWHAENVGFGTRGITAVTQWTRADPRHAGEFIVQLPDSYSFRSAVEAMGPEWAKLDPAGALAFATSQPGALAARLATGVLKDWAERNLTEAADWLAQADERTRSRLSPTFAEVWGKQDAAGALAWCEENLSGSTRSHAISSVLRGAAEQDAAAAAALVSQMSPSAARAEAAAEVAKKWFPKLASGERVTAETVAWLAGLDADSTRRVMDREAWQWATSDPHSMAQFLSTAGSEQVPPHAYMLVARELARRNPAEALEWSSHLSGATALAAGGAAFGEWRDSQPESAMKWLGDLPPGDPRRASYFESAVRQLVYHPQAAEQLAAMNAAERSSARDVIGAMDLPSERRARLMDLLKAR